MDSQSVKNTDSAGNKGYPKKVSGIKRHIAVDTQLINHGQRDHRAGALAMFDRHRDGLKVIRTLVDGGYTGKPFAAGVRSLLGAAVEVVKRNFFLPKRSGLSPGWRSAAGSGRTANESSNQPANGGFAFATLILKRL